MNTIQYVVEALSEPPLCLPAANALRSLCDANRAALAPHLHAFGALHASLPNIPVSVEQILSHSIDLRFQDTERSKVLQSISSVIQALPPEDEIGPVEVRGLFLPTNKGVRVDVSKTIVNPVVTRLFEALQMTSRVRSGDLLYTEADWGSAPRGRQTPRDSTTPGSDWSCQGSNTRI